LQQDPIGLEGGDPNLYKALLNNPANNLDPSGLSPLDPLEMLRRTYAETNPGNLLDVSVKAYDDPSSLRFDSLDERNLSFPLKIDIDLSTKRGWESYLTAQLKSRVRGAIVIELTSRVTYVRGTKKVEEKGITYFAFDVGRGEICAGLFSPERETSTSAIYRLEQSFYHGTDSGEVSIQGKIMYSPTFYLKEKPWTMHNNGMPFSATAPPGWNSQMAVPAFELKMKWNTKTIDIDWSPSIHPKDNTKSITRIR